MVIAINAGISIYGYAAKQDNISTVSVLLGAVLDVDHIAEVD